MHEALRSDCTAYEFAIREGAEPTSPQADSQQAQEVLNGMSDEQRAIVRVLAHRQTHVALRMMGVNNIDPESEAYLQQYNITVISIIGGSILQSKEDTRATNRNQDTDSTSESFDDQLRQAAAQFGRPTMAPRPQLFDFSGTSRNPSRSSTPTAGNWHEPQNNNHREEAQETQPRPCTRVVATPNGVGKTLKDRVILQRWRERDIAESGQSNIPDQGITWDNKGETQEAELERDASHEQRHSQGPPRPPPMGPNPPGGPGEPGESDNGESENEPPRWNSGSRRGCGEHGQIDYRRPAGGDGPPPPPPPGGGGRGSHSSSDNKDEGSRRSPSVWYGGSRRSSTIPRGMRNEEAYQRFRGVIHDKIRRFIDEHLTVRIRLPNGVKPPRLDIKSVKPYDGDPSMEVLWDWLKSLVIHLETQQLGGPDCDRE